MSEGYHVGRWNVTKQMGYLEAQNKCHLEQY